MKCSRCNSENVQMQAKASEPKITVGVCLVFGGLGLAFFGLVGFVIGALVGLLAAVIIKSLLPTGYVSVMVCQSCGYITPPLTQEHANGNGHPLFCTEAASNLVLVRDYSQIGSIVPLTIIIDNYPPFYIQNNTLVNLNLAIGTHTLVYCQQKGMGQRKRSGAFVVTITETRQIVHFVFTADGLWVS